MDEALGGRVPAGKAHLLGTQLLEQKASTTALVFLLLALSTEFGHTADTLKGIEYCMNDEECLGAGRECSFQDRQAKEGRCVCKPGFVRSGDNYACVRESGMEVKETCQRDEDCRIGEVCMTWQYDPGTDIARKLRAGLSPTRGARHQLCIDAWVIQHHMAELEEPRTGGGLRSGRRDSFNADEYFFGGRRPPRVHQQYIGFAEDMMLILFLVCILATLVTVHRATCYRQFQEARRNTPLRHLLPIAEDRPPPYSNTGNTDSVDGVPEVVCSGSIPKRVSETPPPTYEEALYRNSVRLPGQLTEVMTSQAVEITLEEPSISSPPPPPSQHLTPSPAPSSAPTTLTAQVPINTSTPVNESLQNLPSSSNSLTDQNISPTDGKEEGKQEESPDQEDSAGSSVRKTESSSGLEQQGSMIQA